MKSRFVADDFLLPETALDLNGYIKRSDVVLATTIYGLGIESFSNIAINKALAAIEGIISRGEISNLLDSEAVLFVVKLLTQSSVSREAIASLANGQLNRFTSGNFSALDFLLPSNLLTEESGYISKEDIMVVVETFFNLGIDDFRTIGLGSPTS